MFYWVEIRDQHTPHSHITFFSHLYRAHITLSSRNDTLHRTSSPLLQPTPFFPREAISELRAIGGSVSIKGREPIYFV